MHTENGNGNGTGNGQQRQWTLGARTFSDYREFLEAQDLRNREFLMLGARVGPEELGPPLVVPEWATPENFNPEPEWPISAGIDAGLKNRYRLLSAAELNSTPATRYLIPGILAAGQPGGIYGPFKTLKTSLAADLLISLASGTPFLGRFPVSQPGRVLFLSGESGLPALKSIARRICAERGLSLENLDNFVCSPDVPKLGDPFDVMALTELVERERPICMVIDPAFLALGGGRRGRGGAPGGSAGKKSRNLFEMGQLLRPLAELCESTGCAVLVVDHCRGARKVGDPATLEDIAGSGFAEFSAQWLLVSRRQPFDLGTGHHELWLTTGSRAGDHGLWELDVDEGRSRLPDGTFVPEERDSWKTAVRPVTSATTAADERFVADSEDRNLRRRAIKFERQCQRTLELLAAYPDGRTARFLRDHLGMSGDRINRVLDSLIEKGHVVRMVNGLVDRRRPIVTYSRVQVLDLSEAAIQAGRLPQPDPKVYDIGTGQFVSRGIAPAPGAAGVGGAGTLWPAAGGIRNASTRATGRNMGQEWGRDTGRDTSNESAQPQCAALGVGP
jgi:hypothetical protein